MAELIERRRTPRIDIAADEVISLELRHRVQLLDISQSGALLGTETDLPVGTRGQLRAGLAAVPFSAEVSVMRHHTRSLARGQVGLGTQFSAMDDRSRQSLDLFLKRGKD